VFDDAQLKEMHYAAVLHDFGKVGVREHILVKANKLYPGELAVLQTRFDFIKRTLEVQSLTRQVELLRANGQAGTEAALADLQRDLHARLRNVDETFAYLQACNQPTLHPQEGFGRLQEIARLSYESYDGVRSYLTPDEVTALSIPTGSLTRDERAAIETHVSHTYQVLKMIPWTRPLQQVPQIAHAHHEYLDGTGYPRRVTAPEIPVQSRIMTICDIYDALTAADRPYKKAITPDRAIDILELKTQSGQIDAALCQLFVDDKVYEATQKDPSAQ
jgi:response regulator RpfG family c-di-GMP phosphodiesterase